LRLSVWQQLQQPQVSTAWGIALGVVAVKLDNSLKKFMLGWLDWQGQSPAIPGVFKWHVVKNTGTAWSLFHQHPDAVKWMTGLLILGLLGLAVKSKHPAYWLVLGAALSNWLDRLMHQGVIDYIELTFISYPVFNLADIIIVGSAIWLALTYWRGQNVQTDR
jgi:signal peptidase II